MTREEFEQQRIAEAEAEGMSEERWREVFRVYPCWCGQERCPGWADWTEREIQVVLAFYNHVPGLDRLLFGEGVPADGSPAPGASLGGRSRGRW